ncbi:MAG: PEGA domain-containing protein [Myxococcota bacterium]|nr:PEGA domain-containing protein [Myxococcota bacterium]
MNDRPMEFKSRIVAGIVAGALFLSQSPCAWAQADTTKPMPPSAAALGKPDLAAAKKHYSDGEKKFKAGDFVGALAEFRAANDIKATPQAERYVGLSEDALGHSAAAATWYDKFLAHVPDKMATQGDEVRRRLAEIKALPGKVHLDSSPSGANVTVDGKAQGVATPTDLDLPPGTHKVGFTAAGRLPAERVLDVQFASTQTVSAELDPEPPPVAPPPPPPPPVAVTSATDVASTPPLLTTTPSPRSKIPAFVTGGLAIGAAAVGTVFGAMALRDKSDYDKNPTSQIADNGDTHALIADMAFGVALTFGITSAVLFLTKDEAAAANASGTSVATSKPGGAKRQAVTVRPAPFVGTHSGGASVVLQF